AVTSLCACGSVNAGVFFKPEPQSKEKMKRQKHIGHMSMPSRPGAVFIFSHAGVSFSVFKTLFNAPAQGGSLGQFGKRHFFWGIGESIFDLAIGGASHQQPDGSFLREPLMCRKDPQTSDVGQDRAFGSFG